MGPPELDEDHVRLAHYAHKYRQRLAATIVPYWYEVSRDDFGGYLLVDDLRQSRWRRTGRGRPRIRTERKQLVTQARLVWTFSHAHRKGLVDGAHDYLAAADQGYRFLLEHFLDDEKGGYRWMTDRRGRAVNDIKVLYGQAFVIYAFVEYARAGGDPSALQHALDVHGAVHDHLHDDVHGGWFEHAEPDWRPLLAGDHRGLVEIIGLKSANAHLHWFEALTELSATTGHAGVRESLTEAYRVSRRYFYPAEPGRSCQHRSPDWSPVTTAQSACLSYGHSIQFAWLMIHAERALGVGLSWDYFFAHLEHALRYGFDHRRGGVYRSGFDDQPATNTDKVWWAQAEMIAALTDGLQHRWDPRHAAALARLLDFVERHQTDRADGIWLEEVTARGRRRVARTVGPWKDGYHDVRALVKFVEAFASIDGGRSAV